MPLGLDDGAFVIGVPNDFAREWIERRLAKQVAEALAEVLGDTVEVRVVVDARAAELAEKPAPEASGAEPAEQAAAGRPSAARWRRPRAPAALPAT